MNRKTGFLILIIPVLGLILYLSGNIISFFLFAFFMAYMINPMVEFFQKKGARRDWAVTTVYVILFLAVALIIQLIVPRLIKDLTKITQNLPVIFRELHEIETRMIKTLHSWRLPFDFQVIVDELTNRGEEVFQTMLTQLGQGLIQLFSLCIFFILTPLLAYYFSRDYPEMKLRVRRWILNHLGNRWTQTFLKIDAVFRLYIRGQLLDTLAVGFLLGIGLSILGFEAAFLLGFIGGIFNLIPYFGPIMGAIPAVIFGLIRSPWIAVYVVLLFLIVNQLEVMFLAPRLIGGNLGLHPITIIYIILIGGKIAGLTGMILAVPLGAILIIIIKSFYEFCFEIEPNESYLE